MEAEYLLENLSEWSPEAMLVGKQGAAAFGANALRAIATGRLDVIHSHGFTSAGIAAIPARLARIPHIATIHDVITEALERRLGKLGLLALRTAVQQATLVQAVGRDAGANLVNKLLSAKFAKSRLRIVRNGIALDQFSDVRPRSLRAELGLTNDVFVIGFLGRFMAQKGFRTLIHAALKLRESGTPRPFRIVAIGDGGYIREDRAYVTAKSLDSYFTFMPPVEDAAPTLAALDCLVMPSRWEAFSVLACEALCLGVPLVASDCIGLREAVEDTPARVFAAGDADGLARAILEEMNRPSGEKARQFVNEARRRFDVRETAWRIDALFDEVLDAKTVARR
jgi:glycosyltransferase involved in cell wall biosynthesis